MPSMPTKISEFQNHHMDSTKWNKFRFRSDDIIIATWCKSGTTWMQQIVSQLIFEGAENIRLHEASPYMDARIEPEEVTHAKLEAQTHRRFMKTHLPLDHLVYSPQAKYIFVARDGRDAIWSAHNHLTNLMPLFFRLINDTPGRVGPPLEKPPSDPREYFLDFLADDSVASVPLPFWKTIRSWYNARDLPNLLLVHFNDLKADLDHEIRRIANFLDIDVPITRFAKIYEHCTFDYMKENAAQVSPPLAEMAMEGGAASFINKGSNGRWRDTLTADDVMLYEGKARKELGDECAEWLAKGRIATSLGI